jgi:hypothetical protein
MTQMMIARVVTIFTRSLQATNFLFKETIRSFSCDYFYQINYFLAYVKKIVTTLSVFLSF